MCLSEFGISAIAPNSENLFLTDEQYADLQTRFKDIMLFYDNDLPGLRGMNHIKKKHPEIRITFIPRKYDAKDISDFRKMFGAEKTKELLRTANNYYFNGEKKIRGI